MSSARRIRIEPGPGQESVWDYPRPPRVEAVSARIIVVLGGEAIIDTASALRVIETSHPPAYYLPMSDVIDGTMLPAAGQSWCEFKGAASYLSLAGGDVVADRAAWFYPNPSRGFEQLVDRIALYPGRMDKCTVDGEVVMPQEGGFYGGWITSNIVGPFKGAEGTWGW